MDSKSSPKITTTIGTVHAVTDAPESHREVTYYEPGAGAPVPIRSTFSACKTAGEGAAYVLRELIGKENLSEEMVDQVMEETLETWSKHVNPAFLRYRKSVAEDFASCEWRDGTPGGCTLIDSRGKTYIDCLGGYGIFNVGRSHPVVTAAVKAQISKQSLHSQELLDPLRAYAAGILAKTMPGSLQYAFFTNSGTESIESSLKFAMLATGRRHFIGVLGAFHGKSLGALAGTSKATYRKPFGNCLVPFSHIPVNDCTALRLAFEAASYTGNEIAGFIVEPVLGEGGIHVCSNEFLQCARELCDKYGSILIFDEVQSGMGRTGKWWACQHSGVAPDILASAKALGGGVQAAGVVFGTERVWEKYLENPFLFTTTFGGSPVAMAAVIACVSVIESENLCERAGAVGDHLIHGLLALKSSHPTILTDVRGRGLMIGLQFADDDIGYRFAKNCFAEGVLLAGTLINARVIRVEPPLTLTIAEADTVLARMAAVLALMDAEARITIAPVKSTCASMEEKIMDTESKIAVAPIIACASSEEKAAPCDPAMVSFAVEKIRRMSLTEEKSGSLASIATIMSSSFEDLTHLRYHKSISTGHGGDNCTELSISASYDEEKTLDPCADLNVVVFSFMGSNN